MSTNKPRAQLHASGASPARISASRNHTGAPVSSVASGAESSPEIVTGTASERASFRRLRVLVGEALEDMKARDVSEIDVRGRSDVTDLLVIASGTSSRHVRSIADKVVSAGKQAGLPPLGVEGEDGGDWVLVDMGDIVVHVMQPQTRELYGLERLWDVGGSQGRDALPVR